MKKLLLILALPALLLGAAIIGYQDWQLRGSAPGNPASGYLRIWADNTSGIFKCLTSAGAACHFEATATTSTLGISKPDGSTISISGGTTSCTTATTSQLGCVRADGSTITISGGVISASGGGGGGLVLLNTLTASNSASLVDTTSITSTYDNYFITIHGFVPATDGTLAILRFSTNGGSSYDSSASYYYTTLAARPAGSGTGGNASATGIVLATNTSSSNYPLTGSFYLWNPRGAKYKTVTGTFTEIPSAGDLNFLTNQTAGAYLSTTAVNAIQFVMSSGNITAGVIRIYGLSQ